MIVAPQLSHNPHIINICNRGGSPKISVDYRELVYNILDRESRKIYTRWRDLES